MSAPASWRDPGDWPFLLSGVVILAWCNLVDWVVCKLRHNGWYEEREVDQRENGLRIETLIHRSCADCGRVEYQR